MGNAAARASMGGHGGVPEVVRRAWADGKRVGVSIPRLGDGELADTPQQLPEASPGSERAAGECTLHAPADESGNRPCLIRARGKEKRGRLLESAHPSRRRAHASAEAYLRKSRWVM